MPPGLPSFLNQSTVQLVLVILACISVNPSAVAQLIPDGTLDSHASIVNTTGSTDIVNGGLRVGGNLFHSFQEFNVGAGRSLYFTDPNVVNILTRVTGNNPSHINGKLGVNGNANLFLLNPNGILFGAGASLDIRGSFTATTAPAIKFSDGSEFRATPPTPPSLLTVSVPVGLQRGGSLSSATIVNRGNLQAGGNLTLDADILNLQGELQAGQDLNLLATDTVIIRDTVTQPFLAMSGSDLTIRGDRSIDILALNHLSQLPIVSGRNLTLISNGEISGDAHFSSAGSFSLLNLAGQPGDFTSLYDPIIRANGDVVFGNYTGVALKVEATGNIQGGNLRITAPDLTIPTSDPDAAILRSERAVILRAGVPIAAANLPQTSGGTTFVGGIAATGEPRGSIAVGTVNTFTTTGGNGGSIQLSATGTITINALQSYAFPATGNANNGGAISVTAGENITVNGRINSFSQSLTGSAGNGGTIALTSTGGSITLNQDVSSQSYARLDSGSGGAITLSALNNISTLRSVIASSSSEQGNAANGGKMSLTATRGNIVTNGELDTAAETYGVNTSTGNGGAIALSTTTGNITTNRDLLSSSYAGGSSGNGGQISLQSVSGNLMINADLSAYSAADNGNAASGGAISLSTTLGNIITNGFLESDSFSEYGNSGNGGSILVSAPNGQVRGGQNTRLASYSVSEQGTSGNSGNVTIAARDEISRLEILTSASSGTSGSVQLIGSGDLSVINTRVLTSKQLQLQLCRNCDTISFLVGSQGKSGDVNIRSSGNLSFFNSQINSDTRGSDAAGNVTIASGGWLSFNRSLVNTTTSSTGQAGNITATANQGIRLTDQSRLSAETRDRGNAGNIAVTTPELLIERRSQIATTTTGPGRAGSIQIQTDSTRITGNDSGIISGSGTGVERGGDRGDGGNVRISTGTLQISDDGIVSTSTFAQGQGGSIDVTARSVEVTNGGRLSATTQNQGNAGNIRVDASDRVLISTGLSGLFANTTPEASGNGGNIFVTTLTLDISDRGRITAASQGSGRGGDITLTANAITLNQEGTIFAETLSSDGGNINLNVRDMLILRRNSLISASAGTAQAGGNGGNITIVAGFVIGVLSENSDIRANAFTGNGGQVNITAQGIYGLKFQRTDTPFSDITASSQFGTSGTVTLNTLNVDPNRGLVQLPSTFAETNQIVQTCSPQQQRNSFVVTGRGGVSPDPTEALNQTAVWSGNREQENLPRAENPGTNSSMAVMEVTGWQRNADGSISLVVQGSEPTPLLAPVSCQTQTLEAR